MSILMRGLDELRRILRRSSPPRVGGTDVEDARRIADAERAAGGVPVGCAWLDARTIDDLDLALVFRNLDRTRTVTGAQALWRWLAAPATELDVLSRRERALAHFANPTSRARAAKVLGTDVTADAPHLPRLLWETLSPPPRAWPLALLGALVACLIGAHVWGPLLFVAVAIFGVNLVVDDWLTHRDAARGRALELLGAVLARARRLVRVGGLPTELATGVDLSPQPALRRRLFILKLRDPIDLLPILLGGFLVRVLVTWSCVRLVDAERDLLRRAVLFVGEIDALVAIATLRAERTAARVPYLEAGPPWVSGHAIVHPTLREAIGNDLELARSGVLVTGSNMSGKSTFLRAVAVSAILAQSIHTTFGAWRASLLRVRAVMRVVDDTSSGMSTFAVEVAAVGELVAATAGSPTLFVIDEPFSGTNPTIRVPIVCAVLEYLVAHGLVVAATHDLDVATRLDDRFARAYLAERDDGTFDRRIRPGIAPSTNAVELLRRAGYPAAVLERLPGATP